MADVFGRIGNEQVELNNAATEATLRQLIAAVSTSGKGTAAAVSNIAGSAGLNITGAQQQLGAFGKSVAMTGAALGAINVGSNQLRLGLNNVLDLTQTMTVGTGKASDTLGVLARMGGPLGLVFSGMQRLAQFQEQMLTSYRNMSTAGINFGGSLTEIRLAASKTYMTLDQFTALMNRNSESMAMMGSTADDGARSFVKVSQTLLKSDLGDQLRALGYTGETASQSLANYITMTGGRTKEEMKNTNALAQSAAEYMQNLDALSQMTGKSKEALENQLKEEAANAAYQAYLQTLDEEGRKKANAAMQVAMAQGGKGAVQALQGELLGIGPGITKASAEFAGLSARGTQSISSLARNVNDASKTINDQMREGGRLGVAIATDVSRMGKAADVMVMQGNTTVAGMMSTRNRMNAQGIKTEEDAQRQMEGILDNQKERTASEAANAAKTEKAMQELGTTILEKTLPDIKKMLDGMNPLIQGLKPMVDKIDGFVKKAEEFIGNLLGIKTGFINLINVTIALTTAFIALKTIIALYAAKQLMGGGGIPGGGVPGGGGGTGTGRTPGGGTGGRVLRGVGAGSLLGILGVGADLLSDNAQAAGMPRTAAGLNIAGGAATGAGIGAAVGSVVPGVGTAAGAIVGGGAGALIQTIRNLETFLKSSEEEDSESPPAGSNQPQSSSAVAVGSGGESLLQQLILLNNQTASMINLMRQTSDNTQRTYEATRRLDRNLFPSPN
jgi:hypothetical protein